MDVGRVGRFDLLADIVVVAISVQPFPRKTLLSGITELEEV
jgi:hypothetical protein